MTYELRVGSSARRAMAGLHPEALRRIDARIRRLADEPHPLSAKSLRGRKHKLWRIRVGDYRIVYQVDDGARIVSVVAVGPRESVYDR